MVSQQKNQPSGKRTCIDACHPPTSDATSTRGQTSPKKIDEYKAAYSLLMETVKELKTSKTGITAEKVKELLGFLKEYEKKYAEVIRLGKNSGAVLQAWVDTLESIQKAKELLQLLYNFEVDEEYLRENISKPNVFINAKSYAKQLDDLLAGVNTWVGSVEVGMREIWDGLRKEIAADAKKIGDTVQAHGTDAQKRQWAEFIQFKPNLK
jgi:hypothetical protein